MAAAGKQQGLIRSALWLTLVLVAGWVLCVGLAWGLGGQTAVIWMTIAAICCLVPGWIVVFLSSLAIFPNDLAAMLAQAMVRMAAVGAAALLVKFKRPDLGPTDFFAWLIVFYLLALAAEVVLLKQVSGTERGAAKDNTTDNSSTT